MISARAVGSSAEVGSSSTTISGSVIMARAMPTRCCSPTLSSEAVQLEQTLRRADAPADRRAHRRVAIGRQAQRAQRLLDRARTMRRRGFERLRRLLEHELQTCRAAAASAPCACRASPRRGTGHARGRLRSGRATQRPIVVLPEPDSPTSASVSPLVELERDAIDRPHHRFEPAIGKCWRGRSTSRPRHGSALHRENGSARSGRARARGGRDGLDGSAAARTQRSAKEQPAVRPARVLRSTWSSPSQ